MTACTHETRRKYYEDSYLETHRAHVKEIGKDGNDVFVIFDETIFHPQGGGQPSDLGSFIALNCKWNVTKLSESDKVIKHFVQVPDGMDPSSLINTEVEMKIDLERRKELAQIHSAGHLMEDAITQLNLPIEAYKGFHDPQGPSVCFDFKDGGTLKGIQDDKEKIVNKVNELIRAALAMRVEYRDDGTREVQFQGLNKLPCGGTHVRNSSEIGVFSIRKISSEKNGAKKAVKIGYNVDIRRAR